MTYLGSNLLTDAIQKVASGGAISKIEDAVKSSSVVTGAISKVSDAAANQVADAVVDSDVYQTNRERFAVVTKSGYDWVDYYTAHKTMLFVVGLIGTAASSYGIYKRRKVPEAVTLYSVTGIVSAALAFITRPTSAGKKSVSKPPPKAVSASSPTSFQSAIAWADKRAAELTAKSPGWEKKTLTRLWGDVGPKPVRPAVTTLLTKNTH